MMKKISFIFYPPSQKTTGKLVDECKKMLRRDVRPHSQAQKCRADNPDEYAEIIEENFGISYESGCIKIPRACLWVFHFLLLTHLMGCATTSSVSKNFSASTKKDAQTAIGTIANTISGKGEHAKYCPVCGRHFSSSLTSCPKDGTFLKEVSD